MSLFKLDQHACEDIGCNWSDYIENQDWGYYSTTEGDCEPCQDKCDQDQNCGAVECGDGYCSWWKVGTCSTSNADLYGYTCFKSKH